MLLQPGMREPLSHLRQVDTQLTAVRESAVVLDDSESLETVDGDDDAQSVLSGNSIGTTVPNNFAGSESFDLNLWFATCKTQTSENVNDDTSEELNPVSSQQVSQFLQDFHFMDSDQLAVLTLQAEVDRALVTLILQNRDHQLRELKNVSDFREESYSSVAAVQQQLKMALKGGSQNGGAFTMLHCIAMAEVPATVLQETPPLSLWEVAGSTGAAINLLKILTVFYKASARIDQAPVSQVVVTATKVLNKLGNLKLGIKKQSQKAYTSVRIKPAYMVVLEVKYAIDVYMDQTKDSRNSSVGLDAVLHDNKVQENEQVIMARRALDTYDRDHQDAVPQMREWSDVQAQLRMYKGILKRLKQVRIAKRMYMLRPNDVLSNGGTHASTCSGLSHLSKCMMMVQWIYSKGQTSGQIIRVNQIIRLSHLKKRHSPRGTTTTTRKQLAQVKGAYPEVVNSASKSGFEKNENEVLLWVDEATVDVYIQKENIYMAKSGAGHQI